MGRIVVLIASVVVMTLSAVAAFNASFLAPSPTGEPRLLAHRGVHQGFSRDGLTNETCTAARMTAPTHAYLENTLPSIAAAFDYGADMVEIDIHPTTDGDFAVFHDWTLDCRTDGSGRTRDQSMAELRALDAGYGYTADDGATFPFRGSGVGAIPSLGEVLTAFPDQRFMINDKANRAGDAAALAAYLRALPAANPDRLLIFSGPRFGEAWRAEADAPPVMVRREARACAMGYVLTGWLGRVPGECAPFAIAAPQNHAWLYWGWPRRLEARMAERGLSVMLVGATDGPSDGIDTLDELNAVPDDFAGWIVTNQIEVIGPALKGPPARVTPPSGQASD